MNNGQQAIADAVFRAIEELNLTLPPDKKVPKDRVTKLTGASGVLDSLGIVNLIVEAENQIEDAFGVTVNLADQQAITGDKNPFSTVQSLIEYVEARLQALSI